VLELHRPLRLCGAVWQRSWRRGDLGWEHELWHKVWTTERAWKNTDEGTPM